jgi:MFS family permease
MTFPSSNPRQRWMILAVLGTAQLMVVLDATVVNIALPSAQEAPHFSNDNRQWIITAYALAFGSLLLVGGRLSDWFGRKWTLIAGLSGFALASAVVSSGLFALVHGFAHAQTTSWGNPLTIAMLAAGVLLLGVFLALEGRIKTPLLPLRVLANRRFGPRGLIAAGMTLGALGTVYLSRIRVDSSYATEISLR